MQELILLFLQVMLTAIWSPRRDWQLNGGVEIFPNLVPDVFLKLAASDKAEELALPPILVVEIVTDDSGSEYDRLMQEYARHGILYYAIYNANLRDSGDPTGIRFAGRDILEVYRLVNGEYQRQTPLYRSPDLRGCRSVVWMPEIDLGIGCDRGIFKSWQRDWLYWYDERGDRYASPEEMLQQRQEQINLQLEQLARLNAQLRVFRRNLED